MPLYQKECAQCRESFRARVKNTLYCYPCRILKDWEPPKGVDVPLAEGGKPGVYHGYAWQQQVRHCSTCGGEFWPLRKSNYACYACTDRRAGNREEYDCNKCHKHNMPAPGLDTTCWRCVTSTQQARADYIRHLRVRLRGLREAFV